MKHFLLGVIALISLTAMSYLPSTDQGVIVSGSSTVYNFAFNNRLDEWRVKSGVDYAYDHSSSGMGVMALADGKADIAAISSEFRPIVNKLNKNRLSNIDPDDYTVHMLSRTETLFIVHPDNPIKTLTKDQIKDLFTGRIRHWRELGHPDVGPVKIVTEHPTGGIYSLIVSEVNDGTPMTESKIYMKNAPQVAITVSQMKNAFGFLSDATPEDQRKDVRIVNTVDYRLIQNLFLVTKKGEDNPDILKLVKTLQDGFRQSSSQAPAQ